METEDVAGLLRDHNLRVTPQRRAILQAFRGDGCEHLSADEVLARASASVPEISRGTVYATLAELAELGLLASLGSQDVIRYETHLEPHDHFRCRICLRIFDIDLGGRELGDRPIDGYDIEDVFVEARGVCEACLEYRRGLQDGAEGMRNRPIVQERTAADLSAVVISSPIGDLIAAASSHGIARVAFADHADYAALSRLRRSRRRHVAAHEHLTTLTGSMERYFGGDRTNAADPIDWRFVTDTARLTLAAVREIPWAAPRSYELLDDGVSPYECGLAVGSNPVPILIPCHRVCRGSEIAEIYVGGVASLQFLQQLEVA